MILQDVRTFETEALVVGCFEDVRPLKGLAGDLDWLLCGSLSRLLVANKVRGSRGDVALIPPRGKISAQKLFLIGMGIRAEQSLEMIEAFSETAASAVLDAGSSHLALAYEPAIFPEDRYLQSVRAGMVRGSRGRPLNVTLLAGDAASYEKASRIMKQ